MLLVGIYVTPVKQTEKAALLKDSKGENTWFPKSLVYMITGSKTEDGTIYNRQVWVPMWWAKQQGFLAKNFDGTDVYDLDIKEFEDEKIYNSKLYKQYH